MIIQSIIMMSKNSFKSLLFIFCLLLITVVNAGDASLLKTAKFNKKQRQFLKEQFKEKGIKYYFRENNRISIETNINTYSQRVKKLELKVDYEFDTKGEIFGPYLYVVYTGFGKLTAKKLRATYQIGKKLLLKEFTFDQSKTIVRPVDDVYEEGSYIEIYTVNLEKEDLNFLKNLKNGKSIEYVTVGGQEQLIFSLSPKADKKRFYTSFDKLLESLEIIESEEFKKEWTSLK